MKRERRPHQVSAAKKAVKYFSRNSRGKIIWACGTGKTLLAYFIAKDLKARTVLVCVPSLALMKQTLGVWKSKMPKAEYLCVCSDDSVGYDEETVLASDIGNVTTDTSDIARFLRKKTTACKVVFCTYQSGETLCDGALGRVFDFAVFDEAHRTAGEGNAFKRMLHQENVKIRKRLFMTATERIFTRKDGELISMEDKVVYGKTIDSLSFAKAINDKLLSDYKVAVIGVSSDKVKPLIELNNIVKFNSKHGAFEERSQYVAAAIALLDCMKNRKLRHAIAYCPFIDDAKRYAAVLEEINKTGQFPKVDVFHVNGGMTSAERQVIYDAYVKSKRAVITNARCMVEGVDLPSVDCIEFVTPRQSTIDIVQACGRAMRLHGGKGEGCVILPVLCENDKPIDSRFNKTMRILAALATVDERILARNYGWNETEESTGSRESFTVVCEGEFALPEAMKQIQTKIAVGFNRRGLYPSYEQASAIARQAGIQSYTEYRKHYYDQQLPGLPSSPDRTYTEWTSWESFLGKPEPLPAPSLDRLIKECKDRGINTFAKYNKRYKEIPGAPSHPVVIYNLTGWCELFGRARRRTNCVTISQLQKACRRLNIKSSAQYGRRYQEIDGAPSKPTGHYGNQWVSWDVFFGRIQRPTLTELGDAAKALGIQTPKQYKMLYKKIPGAPANPNTAYESWVSWPEFLGTHKKQWSLLELSLAVQKAGINTKEEYLQNRHKVPHAPSRPDSYFKNKWQGWPALFGRKSLNSNRTRKALAK